MGRWWLAVSLAFATLVLWIVYSVSALLTIFYLVYEVSTLLVEWAQDMHTQALRRYEGKQ